MRDRLRADAGVTLIEVIIATVLLGVGVVGVMAAYATLTKTSALGHERAEATRALTVAAERLATADFASDGSPSGYAVAVSDALDAIGLDATVDVSVRCWDGAAFVTSCATQPAAAFRMQQVELDATYRRATETLTVVKRAA
jgi:prepilin-type N-terminal cleavage/methylation domain-containing protein